MPDATRRVTVEVGGRRLAVSNLDKVLYPATETTKGEILNYYARIPGGTGGQVKSISASVLAEHLRCFFFVSVGKLAIDMNVNPEWLKQKHYLSGRSEIPLLPFMEDKI